MNYELAKELKDAGFPQGDSDWSYHIYPQGLNAPVLENRYDDSACGNMLCAAPTLSELIEACGDEFMGLVRMTHPDDVGNYLAFSRMSPPAYDKENNAVVITGEGQGFTLEEAVSRLWLALNKK